VIVAHSPSRSRAVHLVPTCLLASLWLLFFAAHLRASIHAGRPVGIGPMVMEPVLATLFLVRRRPFAVTRAPVAWLVTAGGAFGLLASRPTALGPVAGLGGLAFAIQAVGVTGAVVSLLTLGRAFGLVAADRGLKTRGPFRVVRHPTYACQLVMASGYLLENSSLRNLCVTAGFAFCQFLRIGYEERFLARDPAYGAYRLRVRHRLVPFVY
jgi:protein-S-isoprenylcysteine O-methyltransferase Ste14